MPRTYDLDAAMTTMTRGRRYLLAAAAIGMLTAPLLLTVHKDALTGLRAAGADSAGESSLADGDARGNTRGTAPSAGRAGRRA